MQERDLILGVLAAQTGFATPAQVLEAASAVLLDRGGPPLAARLEASGALTSERRALLETMADAALGNDRQDPDHVPASFDGTTPARRPAGNTVTGEPAPLGKLDPDSLPQALLVPLEREGRYERLGEIGRGGQSVVIRAVDRLIGREVALKELRAHGEERSTPSSGPIVARFLREVSLTAHLDHPGIVTIHDVARRPDGTLFCAQKLIRGETLKTRLARCASLRERLALLPHLIDACQAIAHAHSRGVIHRDLKPSNIMVGRLGETVVVDWGLAKQCSDPSLTVTGLALGTPSYMSPEQARGALEDIDERSDVFGLGAILYQLICGRPPFEGVSNEHVIEKVMAGQMVPVHLGCPDAPRELAAIAARALQPRPDDRYPGVEALADDLLAYLARTRGEANRRHPWDLTKKLIGRHQGLSVAIGIALLVLVGLAVLPRFLAPPGSGTPFGAQGGAAVLLRSDRTGAEVNSR